MTEIANMGAGEQQPDLQSQKSVASINGKKVRKSWLVCVRYDGKLACAQKLTGRLLSGSQLSLRHVTKQR